MSSWDSQTAPELFSALRNLSTYVFLLPASEMVAAVREALGTEMLQGTGQRGGGLISEGEVFQTDGGKVFVKWNRKEKVRRGRRG